MGLFVYKHRFKIDSFSFKKQSSIGPEHKHGKSEINETQTPMYAVAKEEGAVHIRTGGRIKK